MADTNKGEPVYTRAELARSTRYGDCADIINAIVKDGEQLTIKQTDKRVAAFLSRQID